jgi:L,D-peptidoglycan transpeptidase YkuD (ErfK/YbiS/YcfS/YnhG family)
MKNTYGQLTSIHKKEIIQLIKANKEKLNNVEQLVLAINNDDSSNKAILVALEFVNKKWKMKLRPVQASIGRTGFALPGEKMEGDGKSPTGVFDLGQLYTYEASVNTSLPFIQTSSEDKWIDDPNHETYNTHIRGNTTAKSFEHLKLSSIDYKYCMVIEYNTHPAVKGKGSAIFFHLATPNYDPTAGCVAIQESDMDKILLWLDPNKQKAILMGNKNHLQK